MIKGFVLGRKEALERCNRGTVDINRMEHGDLCVGQRVLYEKALGGRSNGYVTHFHSLEDSVAAVICSEQGGMLTIVKPPFGPRVRVDDFDEHGQPVRPWVAFVDESLRDLNTLLANPDPSNRAYWLSCAREAETAGVYIGNARCDGFNVEQRTQQLKDAEKALRELMATYNIGRIAT